MFGMGFLELVVIAVVALVFIGPKKLPDFMKQAGRFFVQMRRTANDVRSTFDEVVRDAETQIRKEEAEAMRGLLAAKPVVPVTPKPHDPLNGDGHLPPADETTPQFGHRDDPSQHLDLDPGHNSDGTLKPDESTTPEGTKTYQPGGTDATPPPKSEM